MTLDIAGIGFNLQHIGVATMVLFAVIDIVGSIPIIINIKEKAGGQIFPLRTTFVALFILVLFLFLGESILQVIGLDTQSFAVAGSFVLFFMSLEMILGISLFKDDGGEESPKVASVVPLAFPIIAGAGSMTSLVSLRAEYAIQDILVAIVINMLVVALVLVLTKKIERLLGRGGIAIIKKVFGIILLAIAVKLFTENLHHMLHVLEGSKEVIVHG